ncbi:hypothetical protein [Salinisphaera sp. T5B8]|uniref:hypothetical protein n=1 Tax=Salinisphaera sp. T5B8 TaxID=1304154 RepID=UPI003342A18B
MTSVWVRGVSAACVVVSVLLTGCSQPGGTAVLEFGEHDPLNGGMRALSDTLRASLEDQFGEFGRLRIESMEPVEIPHESESNPGTTFYSHRYRLRLTFVDDLDDSQRQAIRAIFDGLHDARENWPRGITVDGQTSDVALGERGASLIFFKEYRYGIEIPAADNPTHCTVWLELEPPLPIDIDTFASAAAKNAIDFAYAPLQQAFASDHFAVAGPGDPGVDDASPLQEVRLDFGVVGDAIDMGAGRAGMASSGSQQACNQRVAEAGRPFSFTTGWTFDRVVDAELTFPENG